MKQVLILICLCIFVENVLFSSATLSTTTLTTLLPITSDLPIASSVFTTDDDNIGWQTPTASLYCYNIIVGLSQSTATAITGPQQKNFQTYLNNLSGPLLLGATLNDSDKLIILTYKYWYDYIISKSFATSISSQGYLTQYNNLLFSDSIDSGSFSDLQSSTNDLQAQVDSLSASITQLQADQKTAIQTLETNRLSAYQAFATSDIFLRGRLGTINNNSSISYQLVDSTGLVLDTIIAGQTSSRVYVLSDYANDQQATMFTLVPYNGVGQITSGSAAWELSGGTIVILGNSVGLNTPGNPYGYADSITITRVYPEDEARAHVVDLTGLVTANQYWQVDFTINPLISVDLGDGTTAQVIYPFISKIETSTQGTSTGWDVTKDFPTAAEAIMDTTITITRSNSSKNSYPAFDSADANSYWSDLAS